MLFVTDVYECIRRYSTNLNAFVFCYYVVVLKDDNFK